MKWYILSVYCANIILCGVLPFVDEYKYKKLILAVQLGRLSALVGFSLHLIAISKHYSFMMLSQGPIMRFLR